MSLHYHYKQKAYELGRDKNVSLMRPFVNMHQSSLFICLFFTFIGNMTHSSSDVAIFVVSFLQTRSIKNDLLQLCSMSSKHFWKYDLILGLSNISKLRTSYDCNLNIIQIYLFSSCVGGWSLREKHPNIYVTNERNRANLRLLTKRCNCNVF